MDTPIGGCGRSGEIIERCQNITKKMQELEG